MPWYHKSYMQHSLSIQPAAILGAQHMCTTRVRRLGHAIVQRRMVHTKLVGYAQWFKLNHAFYMHIRIHAKLCYYAAALVWPFPSSTTTVGVGSTDWADSVGTSRWVLGESAWPGSMIQSQGRAIPNEIYYSTKVHFRFGFPHLKVWEFCVPVIGLQNTISSAKPLNVRSNVNVNRTSVLTRPQFGRSVRVKC